MDQRERVGVGQVPGVAFGGVLAFSALACAQETTLRAVTSFAEKTTYSRGFERFVERVNEAGKGVIHINYIGGPKAMPPFEVGNALKSGVVDIANVTGAFYTNLTPEADAWKLTERPMSEIRAELTKYPVKTRLSLTGTMIVARDIAHAKIAERLDAGQPMPGYLRDHPVYYAGPAKTPEGYASGSFGPTTAGRMDSYVERFQAAGGSLVMLAKGNRSAAVTEACKRHGGFYLGSIGGAAARLAQDCITKVDVLEYPELGMEAVWKIEVRDFPAFIIVDDKGKDFFAEAAGPLLSIGSHP